MKKMLLVFLIFTANSYAIDISGDNPNDNATEGLTSNATGIRTDDPFLVVNEFIFGVTNIGNLATQNEEAKGTTVLPSINEEGVWQLAIDKSAEQIKGTLPC